MLEQFGCRFVVRILRDEFATDGEVEDGLAELLDVFGARGEAREVAEMKAGVLAELVHSAPLFSRCRDAAAKLSAGSPAPFAPLPTDHTAPSIRPLWRRYGVVRRVVEGRKQILNILARDTGSNSLRYPQNFAKPMRS